MQWHSQVEITTKANVKYSLACALRSHCNIKGGLGTLSESAFTWSMMVNTYSRVEKCTRKAFMRPWQREIHLNTAVLTLSNHECWPEGVEATPTKHGPQLGLGNIKKITYSLVPTGFSLEVTGAFRNLKNRLFTKTGISPPTGIQQTPACQIQLPHHELPTTPPTCPHDASNIARSETISKFHFAFRIPPKGAWLSN